MTSNFLYLLLCLIAGIAVIVLLTTRYKAHPFFALLIASLVVGLGVGLPAGEVITAVKGGFGNILKSLGLIIVLGTTLGVVLEHTGSTRVMASFILKKVSEKRAPLAMSITGFIVGLPIFCDSGYIVLSGLNQSLARRTQLPLATMAISLATGLYAVHCLVPPHPGASAAAGIIGVDFGKLILIGIVVAIPAAIIGHAWAMYAGKKDPVMLEEEKETNAVPEDHSVLKAFLPIVLPITLIAFKSFLPEATGADSYWMEIVLSIGDPSIALGIGILLAFNTKRSWQKKDVSTLLQDSAEKAGGILVIIGAGGAFGAVLEAAKIGDHLNESFSLQGMGLLFPFLLTVILKTAQGSSTVAIITASSIVQPMLPSLGITTETELLLCVLSMGAGSMMISHANDAYFWVISKFSGLEMKPMLYVYSVASILMGFTSFVVICILSWILP